MTAPRYGFHMGYYDKRLYALGGGTTKEFETDGFYKSTTSVEVYDEVTGNWTMTSHTLGSAGGFRGSAVVPSTALGCA